MKTQTFRRRPQYFHLGFHTFRYKSIGDTQIFNRELSPYFLFLNPNLGTPTKIWKSPRKSGVSNENIGVSQKILDFINENLEVNKENQGSPRKAGGSTMVIWRSLLKIWVLQRKSGRLQKNLGSPMKIWGFSIENLGPPMKMKWTL